MFNTFTAHYNSFCMKIVLNSLKLKADHFDPIKCLYDNFQLNCIFQLLY